MNLIYNLFNEILKTGFSFQDLFLISNIYIAINSGKKINAKDLYQKCPNASSISTIHRRLHLLREKGIIDINLDYVDGRKTFIVKGPNFDPTITNLQTMLENISKH